MQKSNRKIGVIVQVNTFHRLNAIIAAFGMALFVVSTCTQAQQLVPPKAEGALRIATYNASLNRAATGKLTADLKSNDAQVQAIATVVRAVQPDILLINEIDFSTEADNAALLEQGYFAKSTPDLLGGPAWPLKFHYSAASNTGTPSGMDLDNNGRDSDPNDAFGFGRFPGQYGMAVFSRYEIATSEVVTLKDFLWSKLPGALRPIDPKTGKSYYADATWEKLRLSSKSFWDVPIRTPGGTLHVLASHPTPPAFDGAEDRNGCRNHDEIKLVQLYIESSSALTDDRGNKVSFSQDAPFIVLGDLNCDPKDGDSKNSALNALINHPQMAKSAAPRSSGGEQASERQAAANTRHKSDPAEDTADFSDNSVGNLRADYALPSKHFKVTSSGIFWPLHEDVRADKVETIKKLLDASDHHLVWVDVQMQ
jgi:Endonuclease/Exonuclease/phosphatase family